MQVKRAPRFIAVKGSNTNKERKSIELLFAGLDGEHYAIELDPSVIAPAITAMSSHLNGLSATDPDLPNQALNVQQMELAMSPKGQVGLQLQLDGALQLVLRFPPEQIPALEAILDALKGIADRKLQ